MPKLSIGLPVYNGEKYLKHSIESILSQSFEDFELIISDNASTDSTQEICLSYASKDKRISYFRNEKNLGASKNFNETFWKSKGQYFKWASNDDICAPDFFAECLEMLEKDPSAVLCCPRTRCIDSEGRAIYDYDLELRTSSDDPQERFYDLVFVKHGCYQVFGIIRSEVLKKTKLINNYSGSDRVLLAELSLYGKFLEVPRHLFLRRIHPEISVMLFPGRNNRYEWFDTSLVGKITFAQWRIFTEYALSVKRSPLGMHKKIICYFLLKKWGFQCWKYFAHDLKNAVMLMLDSQKRTKHS